jgi:hypothetical protein
VRRADGCGPPLDFFLSSGTTALSARNDNVDVSDAKFPDYPFSIELGDTEINTQIQGVLAHVTDLNLGSSPIPLREGVDSPWVSPLGLSLGYLCWFLLLTMCVFPHRISGKHAAPHEGGSPYLRMW